MRRTPADNRGFSLVWMAVIVAVAGIMMAAILPGGELGSDAEKRAITLQHMQKIEEATHAFMAANLRRPCPADATQAQTKTIGGNVVDNSNFGIEASNPGSCAGGAIAANFIGGSLVNTAAAGGVPTKALGISDDYALDGYGRRIMYVVDRNATAPQTCHDLESQNITGKLRILSSYNATSTLDYTMWALVSYGKSGQGAYPSQGGSTRLDVGNASADTANNAFGSTGSLNSTPTFTGTLVHRDPIVNGTNAALNFDDTVWYLDSTKNICALGKEANNGFRITGTDTATTNATNGVTVATGDINGDGIPDLVIGMPSANSGAGAIYVIFGSPYGWPQGGLSTPTPFPLSAITGTGSTISSISGNPPTVTSGLTPATGNPVYITGVSGMTPVNNRCYLAGGAGGSSFTLTDRNGINVDALNWPSYTSGGYAMNGCGAIINNNLGIGTMTNLGWTLAVGDLNADGFDDIVASGVSNSGASQFVVIFGNSTFPSINLSAINLTSTPTAGVQIKTQSHNIIPNGIAIGDFNGDGIKDVIFSDAGSHAYVLFGQSSLSNWSGSGFYSSPTLDLSNTSTNFTGTYGFTITGSTTYPFPSGFIGGLAAGDLNGAVNGSNNIDDIVLGSSGYSGGTGSVYVLLGRTSWASDFDSGCSTPPCNLTLSTQIGTASKAVQFTTTLAGSALGNYVLVSDINADGIPDLIMASNNYIYGYYGSTTAWGSATVAIDSSDSFKIDTMSNRPGIISGSFPKSLAVGDINGDGVPDLLLGSYNTTLGSQQGYGVTRSNAGSLFVIDQPTTLFTGTYTMFGAGLSSNSQWFNSSTGNTNTGDSTYGFRIDGSTTNDYLCYPVVLDLNNDGKNDIVVTAPGNGGGSSSPGGLYVLYGRRTVPYDAATDTGYMQ